MRRLLLGLAARIPGLNGRIVNRGTGGTNSAQYCFDVWLKHLTLLVATGYEGVPASVAELGPGDSLGVGLAAILCGADTYRALDVKRFSNPARNLRILDELVELFRRRCPRSLGGWPDYDRFLDQHLFPSHILDEERLHRSLAPERLEAVRAALGWGASPGRSISIAYAVPWEAEEQIERGSVDLILSHSVLEHVHDLKRTHQAAASWLVPGGWVSHQIDLTSHGLAREWNGAWGIGSEFYWRLIAERRDCWINRAPASPHVNLLEEAGFDLRLLLQMRRDDGIPSDRLADPWKGLSPDDLSISGLFIQAQRRI